MQAASPVGRSIRGLPWLSLYLTLTLLPGVVALFFDPFVTSRPALVEVSVALGFVAFALIATQFALVSRCQASSRPFGTDALVQFHQYVGGLAMVLLLAHPLLLNTAGLPWSAWSPVKGSLAMRSGAIAFWALAGLVASTVFRRRLRLSYEAWQRLHLALAVVTGLAMLAHALAVNGYSRTAPVRVVLLAYATAFGLVAIDYRLLRPIRLTRRPWEIVANEEVGGSTRLLRVRPVGHAGFTFEPGQFAWLVTGETPVWSQQHPLSIASSGQRPPDGALEFSVKALGDWSGRVVPTLHAGTRVWVDGPFGAFTSARKAVQGFVMIAGGIGIAPMRSILLSMRDDGDQRHVVLFVAVHDDSRLIFREDIERLRSSLNLDLVVVFEVAPPDWPGERGQISTDTLRRHLPAEFVRYHYFVCGPPPMMDAVEHALVTLGVSAASIDSERFNLV